MCADGAHLVKQSALSSSSVCEMAFLGHTHHRNIASAGHAFVFANTLSLLLNVHECASLKDVMQAHPLHEEHVAEVCIQLLRALDYLHRRNIVHGNLEPESILIDRHGYAHLINFERAVKAGDGVSDFRTDLHGLGCLVVQMVTGKPGGQRALASSSSSKELRQFARLCLLEHAKLSAFHLMRAKFLDNYEYPFIFLSNLISDHFDHPRSHVRPT